MNPVSNFPNIPGVNVRVLDEKEVPKGRQDKQYEVMIDPANYDYSSKKISFSQKTKKISFNERFTLGRLIGYNPIKSFALAIISSFKSQKNLTEFYIDKLKKIQRLDFYKKGLEFYNERQVSKEALLKKIQWAYDPKTTVKKTDQSFDDSLLSLFNKALSDLKSINYNPTQKQIIVTRDLNDLQTIAGITIRCNKYNIYKRQLKENKVIMSELLLSIPKEPIFNEVQKIQHKFLEILGFEVNS